VLRRLRGGRYVVLLDSLEDRSGIDVLKQIRIEWPALPVLMLTMHPEEGVRPAGIAPAHPDT
jgi:DNA-binding NarL/FixJ family response regulator